MPDGTWTFNQTQILDNSSFTLVIRSESTLPEVNKFVSSANKKGSEYLQTETRSFIYSRNNIGPKIEP